MVEEVGVALDDVVLSDGHGVDLDPVGDALGVPELASAATWRKGI